MSPAASWSLILCLAFGGVLWSLTSIIARRERERHERNAHDLHRRYGSHRRVS